VPTVISTIDGVTYLQTSTIAGEGKVSSYRQGSTFPPPGWEQPAFDDSFWTAPVVATLGTDPFPPADNPAATPPTQLWGDPLWISPVEIVPERVMLYRFHLNVPAGDLVRSDHISPGLQNGTFALIDQQGTANLSYVNGLGFGVGLTNAFFQASLVIGDNLIAVAVPTDSSRPALALGRWASFMFQLAYLGSRGRSSVQFVG